MRIVRLAAVLLALAAPLPGSADILLQGSQHVGDCNDFAAGGAACAGFTPLDPQGRSSMANTLIKFHLSTTTTITGLQLNTPLFPDLSHSLMQVHIQSLGGTRTLRWSGTPVSGAITLTPSLVLTAGSYSLLIDAGCSSLSGGTYFYNNCGSNNERDFGFSSVTLLSAQTTTSRMFNRRRHIGDNPASDDGDDDYSQSADDRFYPDGAEGTSISETFTLGTDQRLTAVSFYSARDINTGVAAARVYIDGMLLGSLDRGSSATAPQTISTNLLLQGGIAHTLLIDSVASGGNRDDVSWDDIILTSTDTVSSGTPGLFNAVDTLGDGLSGTLGTKAAGDVSPAIDIVALDALGTGIDGDYVGTVTVELMDATTDGAINAFTGCQSSWTPVAGMSTSVTFSAANGGRAPLAGPFFSHALRKAALRMTDTSTGAVACSTDRFALRPHRFIVTASHGTPTTPGATPLNNTGTGGDPQHRAGQPFTVTATAVDASGNALATYTGTPENSHDTDALAPATVDGSVSTPSWSAAGAVRSTVEARYSEAGAFTLQLRDKTWSDTDSGQSTDTQRWILGTVDVGRFTPDHFAFAESLPNAEFDPGCSDSFTYMGQSFGYALVPTATITAMTGDAAPTVTRNYTDGALFKLPASIGNSTFTAASGTLTPVNVPIPENTVTNLGNGIAQVTLAATSTFAFTRPATPLAPFDAEIAITLGALGETDGIDFSPASPGFGLATAGNGVDFTAGAKSVRFGRLAIDNAQGSELRALDVPLRAEYWNTGFQASTTDNCTDDLLATANIVLTGPLAGSTTPTLASSANGRFTLNLTAPGTPGVVNVEAAIAAALPWLQADGGDADGDYEDNPAALVTFGLASDDQDRRIFSREVVGY